MELASRYRACLLGLACGDAVGTTLEFRRRGDFAPIDDMVGGGPFGLPAGAWTDDTSMALCFATSLVECGGFDPTDQMQRYLAWYERGYLSSTGRCFDIGNSVRAALVRFKATGDPFAGSADPTSAGNGSIMRLAPVPMFYFPVVPAAVRWAGLSSRTTHGAEECVEACELLAAMLCAAYAGNEKHDVLFGHDSGRFLEKKVRAIARGDYRDYSIEKLSGSGYVIRSLEAAAWCFWRTSSFREAVLAAANLGDDADTTAAVCGQIAGAYYGEEGIPPQWLAKLARADEIRTLADRLFSAGTTELK